MFAHIEVYYRSLIEAAVLSKIDTPYDVFTRYVLRASMYNLISRVCESIN